MKFNFLFIKPVLALAFITLFFSIAHPAFATSYTWTGATSTSWSQPANWSPYGVPGAGDTAAIATNKTVDVTSDVTVYRLSIGGASTLRGAGNLTVKGVFDLKGASLTGSGVVNIPTGAIINFDNSGDSGGLIGGVLGTVGGVVDNLLNVLVGKVIYNSGTANLNTGNLDFSADFNNNAGAVFQLNSDTALRPSGLLTPTFKNAGTVIKAVGSGTTTVAVRFRNTGMVDARTGTLSFSGGYTQSAGSTQINGGSIAVSDVLDLQGGQLQGTGTIRGNVRSSGSVRPGHSPGAITIVGNYTQTSSGSLDMEIAGLSAGTQYDVLNVTGVAQLAGALNIFRLGNPLYVPPTGSSFELVTAAGGLSGQFSTTTGMGIGNGLYFRPSYGESIFAVGTSADSTKPTVAVSTPTQLSSSNPSPTASGGSATDSGSGLFSVTLALARYSSADSTATPNAYWNWSTNAFTSTYSVAAHEKTAQGYASWNTVLPSLPIGYYGVRATAKDIAGNATSSAWVRFSVPAVYFTLSGRVANSSGVAIANVVVKRTGSTTSVKTNSAGYYTFTGVANGSYTITPSLTGYSFTPVSKTATVSSANLSGQNFIGTKP